MMILLLDPQIAGWPLKQVDSVRKSIAKKNKELYEKLSQEYYENAKAKNLSPALTRYVWDVLIAPQRSYSFCSSHGLCYSIVALQEMNLATNYPSIFWNTANLIVDSAGLDGETEDEDIDDDGETTTESEENTDETEEEDDEEEVDNTEVVIKEVVKRTKKSVDYGRTAAAIGRFKSWGITVIPPDINNSTYTFSPDADKNVILYGLRGITNISADLIKTIIKGRPYVSFKDFKERIATTKIQTINLIKAGCFDSIAGKTREELMRDYLSDIADKKNSLTISSMNVIIENNLMPKEMEDIRKIYFFNKNTKEWKKGDFYLLPEKAIGFIAKYFSIDLVLDGDKLPIKTWKKAYDAAMAPFKEYIKNHKTEMLRVINENAINEVTEKYALGTTSKWEMESLSFYAHEHELAKMRLTTAKFDSLPKKPVPTSWINLKKGDKIPLYDLQLLAGTVIDKNKIKNTITLLTTDGVVLIKLRKEQFTYFDKQISCIGEDGKKHVIEKSWFTKGTLLLVQGIRRDDNFILKKYKSSYYPTIAKIESLNNKGVPNLTLSRMEENEE